MSNTPLTIADLNNMSSEDFDKLDPSVFDNMNDEDDGQSGQENEHDSDSNTEDDDDEKEDNNDQDAEGDEGQSDDDNEDDSSGAGDEGADEEDGEEESQGQQQQQQSGKTETSTTKKPKQEVKAEVTAEVQKEQADFYAKVTGEFKANGKTYKVSNAEEAVSLMQKGLNYNAKMDNIKHLTAAGRVLEQHDLLGDPDKLAFLIDLHNKKPEAIAKLIKDSGVDTYELDDEKANNYKPTPVNVPSENVIALQEIVATNKEDADFIALYGDVGQWDEASQQIIVDNPTTLQTLLEHKKSGLYDEIMQRVNHARDIQGNKTPAVNLYYQVGQQMYGNGGTDNKAQAQHSEQKPAPTNRVTKKVDPALAQKRKNIGGVKSTASKAATKTALTTEQIYSLSPEEFAKLKPEDFN